MDQETPVVKLIECPRDAMQGWHRLIPTEEKINYLQQLLLAGFDCIDCGSFVSPKAIPQMADTADVLRGITLADNSTRLLVIVANLRGAEEAARFEQVHYLGFPFSVSETFQQRNAHSDLADSFRRVADIQQICRETGKELVVYLSMAFGNPYGDPYSAEIVLDWAKKLADLGVGILSLADTVGLAAPNQVEKLSRALLRALPTVELGLHLHARPEGRIEKLAAGWLAGCRRFDGALGGFGGCPMADDSLVGNMDTQTMIHYFESRGIQTRLHAEALQKAALMASEIFT